MADHQTDERVFDDDKREARWRARFTAPRLTRPDWARDAPDRSVYASNATGTWELYAWDRATDTHRQFTDRPNGTAHGTVSPDGQELWWFADTDGDEFGHWVVEPFAGRPAEQQPPPALPGVPDAYSAGLDIGRIVVAAGASGNDGSTIWVRRGIDEPAEVIYQHVEDAGVGALSDDEALLAISHSEHGDSRHPSIRVLRVADGATVAELGDGPGLGLDPLAFAPVPGDSRLLAVHERRGREELLIFDVYSGEQTELGIELPGELSAEFYPDGSALLIMQTHGPRTTLHRYDLATGKLSTLDTAAGSVSTAGVRPDHTVEYAVSSAATPPAVRALHPDGTDRELLAAPGPKVPGSVPVTEVWVPGPGGDVPALVARPPGDESPRPTVFSLHGGPHGADEDSFDPWRAAWVDAGFAVVEVNYRGSTNYGSAWRDAIQGNPGLTELADVAAVHDWAVASGLVDPARCIVEGWSWGGYLALLALGTQPKRWTAGIAGVPLADWVTAYDDQMEQLRAFDRALVGGSPAELPERFATASPITYAGEVSVPLLVLAGENDPRCPIRQVENYFAALVAAGKPHEVRRFDAGHGSLVVAQVLQHVAAEINFALRCA